MSQNFDVPGVHVRQVDDEHAIQVGLAHALCRALADGSDDVATEEVIEQMLSFSDAHFVSEQLLMRLSSYLDYDDHVADHDRFAEAMRAIAEDWRAGRREGLSARAEALRDALAKHITTRDRAFTAYHQRWLDGVADPGSPGVF